jgi:energy-coupling factor transporter ATP-binding protein EcfA2
MWHRWDPHLHAPGTALADQFKGDWESYLASIETSEPRVRALGVTDYFCIQTYKEARKFRDMGRLREVDLLFPNVEMRLDIKTAAKKPINLHLLFSPDDPNHEYEIERILGQLRFKYQEQPYACNRQELIRLGRAFNPRQSDEDGAFRTGVNQFKTTLPELQNLFLQEKKWLSRNCLVAVAGKSTDGTSGLQEDASFAAQRQELERFADIIFSSSPQQRDFWLGKHPDYPPEKLEATYRSLKPCMHGSDAHRLEVVGAPTGRRCCWLKGDLAFETLRQTVLEPEDRVSIGEEPPPGLSPSETFLSVEISDAPWLASPFVQLNPGLVTIIGARGSGKTALMELLAAGAEALTSSPSDSSFLQRADDLLGDAAVNLHWSEEGKENTRFLSNSNSWMNNDSQGAMARYLSQQFVDRLCSSAGLAIELRQEMERVVFDATDQSDRMQRESFQELAELLLTPPSEARAEFQQSISEIGDEVIKEDQLRARIPELAKSIKTQQDLIAAIKKEQGDLVPKAKEAHAKRLQELEELCRKVESNLEELRLRRKTIVDLGADVKHTIESREPARFLELKRKYSGAQLRSDDWESFRMAFVGEVQTIVQRALADLDRSIRIVSFGDPAKPKEIGRDPESSLPLSQLRELRDTARKDVGIDDERQKKYGELQRSLIQAEGALRRLEEEEKHAKGALDRRNELIARRRNEYVEVFKTFHEEERALADLYGPLRKRLDDSEGTLGKLRFIVERNVRLDEWVSRGEGLIDLRRDSGFRGHGALKKHTEKLLLGPWRIGSPDEVADAMEKFLQELGNELMKAIPDLPDEQAKRVRKQEIGTWVYSTDHIKIQYGITYDGTPIERLSPGTRGIVLLLLYLAVDIHDRRPLLIDQPEENLDPRSVFSELVPHFRKAKKRRQIIMVTHNANLVVNTDADQVIVATAKGTDGGGLPEITYMSGSIENPLVRTAVCRLLEGGRRAFLDRERRYRIHDADADVYTDDAE